MRTKKLNQNIGEHSFVSIEDIHIPDIFYHPLKSGIYDLDLQFSEMGGLIPSQSIMLTGEAGAGKTTMIMLYISRLAKNTGRPAAFFSLEMSDFQLKLLSKKLGNLEGIIVCQSLTNIELAIKKLNEIKPSVVVLDSIQYASQSLYRSCIKGQKDIVKIFTKFAKDTFTPVVLIGHVGKDGKYIGPADIMHTVDTHINIWKDRSDDSKYISCNKNRFGGKFDDIVYRIFNDGVGLGNCCFGVAGDTKIEDRLDIEAMTTNDLMYKLLNELRSISPDANDIPQKNKVEFATVFTRYLKEKYSDRLTSPDIKILTVNSSNCKNATDTDKVLIPIDITRGKRYIFGHEKTIINELCAGDIRKQFMWYIIHQFVHAIHGKSHNSTFFNTAEYIAKDSIAVFAAMNC
jgi:hypothetical protein